MKNLIQNALMISLVTFSMTTFASGDHQHGHGTKMEKKEGKRIALEGKTKDQVLSALKANESLHGAFFEYDAKKAETQAQELKKAIAAIEDPKIAKLLKVAQSKLDQIQAKQDREDNNQAYHQVSMALIHILNNYDVGAEYNAYSCPMVKKKWVQNSKNKDEVNNPYAASMPLCGSKDSHY